MADEKPNHDDQRDEEANAAWARFRVFVSKVAAVPKEEVDEKRREREQDGKRAG